MHTTQNTLSVTVRQQMIELLQARLADGIDLMTQAKQAHWNVKGSNFIALHELFDQIHTEMDNHVDLLAERLVSLGGQAHGTARTAAQHSTLPEYPLDITHSNEHIDALSSALAAFGGAVRTAIDTADESGDQGTADIFTEVSRALDKSLWFVESHKV